MYIPLGNHEMEILFTLLALCQVNPMITGGLPSWRYCGALFFIVKLEQAIEQRVKLLMIWDTWMFMWHHCNDDNFILHLRCRVSVWVIKFNSIFSDITFHISHVNITYTLESLSSLKEMTYNLRVTIKLKKKRIKKETQKIRAGTHKEADESWQQISKFTKIYIYKDINIINIWSFSK